MLLVGSVGGLLPAWIAGPIVDNFSFGSDYYDCAAQAWRKVSDFKIPFFIQDGIYLIMIVIVYFFIDIKINKSPERTSFKNEFSWLLNPAAIAFYLSSIVFGIMFGAYDTFFFPFAQETLGASTSFLGYTTFCLNAGSILFLLFAKPVLRCLGLVNTVCMVSIVEDLFLISPPKTSLLPIGWNCGDQRSLLRVCCGAVHLAILANGEPGRHGTVPVRRTDRLCGGDRPELLSRNCHQEKPGIFQLLFKKT